MQVWMSKCIQLIGKRIHKCEISYHNAKQKSTNYWCILVHGSNVFSISFKFCWFPGHAQVSVSNVFMKSIPTNLEKNKPHLENINSLFRQGYNTYIISSSSDKFPLLYNGLQSCLLDSALVRSFSTSSPCWTVSNTKKVNTAMCHFEFMG